MAWRLAEPDAPGLLALVTDEGGAHIPTEPDIENLIIGICDLELDDPLMVLEIDGRAGLCRWYVQNVGHDPDKERGGPPLFGQLIEDRGDAHAAPLCGTRGCLQLWIGSFLIPQLACSAHTADCRSGPGLHLLKRPP